MDTNKKSAEQGSAYKEIILINVDCDDPTRGDIAGWRGLGRSLSKRFNREAVYVDDKLIRAAYPDAAQSEGYDTLLARYLNDNHYIPSHVIGHVCNTAIEQTGQNLKSVHQIHVQNEFLSSSILKERELVSHHLTQDILAEHTKHFDAHHPTIKTPIMAVMLVDPYGEGHQDYFANKIVQMMAHYENGSTIYLCGSRRTTQECQQNLQNAINKEITKKYGGDKKIDVLSHEFHHDSDYNPYIGLIARAKHFTVWGDSQSLMSEALYSGRPVYLYKSCSANNLIDKGYVYDFTKIPERLAPPYKEFPPLNLTDKIANVLIERRKFEEEQNYDDFIELIKKSFNESVNGQIPDAWLDKLNNIRLNFHTADNLEIEYKENADFVKLALQANKSSLRYFPLFKNNNNPKSKIGGGYML